jgi:hypothetical protein
MSKYCPDAQCECKKELCVYWYNKINDCSRVYATKYDADIDYDFHESSNIGLEKINKELSEVLTTNYLNLLSRSIDMSDNDQILIKKLSQERKEKVKLIDIKKGYNTNV